MADTIEIIEEVTATVEIAGPIGPQGPAGSNGSAGAAATVSVGTVTTGDPGTSASVTNSGTSSAAVLDFTIPRGEDGDEGGGGVTSYNDLTDVPSEFDPSAHAASHQAGGSDEVFDQDLSTTDAVQFSEIGIGTSSGGKKLNILGNSDSSAQVVIKGAQWFGSVNGNQGVLYQGDIEGKIKVIALNSAFSQYKTLEFVSDGDTFTFPQNGGTLARLSDLDPLIGVAASYTGIGDNETFSEEVTITANTAGDTGNNITLTFDGVDDVDAVLAAWNSANPSNQATLISGDGAQVPDNGDALTLSGGVNAIFAPTAHTHGSITNDGKVGSTAGLPLKTGTAGVVEAGAFGTSAGEFAEGNHTHTLLSSLRIDPKNASIGILKVGNTTSGENDYVVIDNNVRIRSSSNSFMASINATALSSYRTITLPDSSGTVSLQGHTHSASDITSGTIATARLGTGTANGSTFLAGDQTYKTVSGVTTGSVDNAIIRADGTGGSTSQSSDISIDDASTTTANNVTISNQHSGQTNSSLVLSPKGTGAFIVGPKPDGVAAVGGNARGTNAVDFGMVRTAATQVASGVRSFIGGGANNTASGQESVACGGSGNTASGQTAVVAGGSSNTASGFQSSVFGGRSNTASNDRSMAAGDSNTSSSTNSCAIGATNTASATTTFAIGSQSRADRQFFFAHAGGVFASNGDAQRIRAVLRCKTTTNTAVEMALDGSTTYLTIPSGKVIFAKIRVVGVKSDGSAVATYERQYAAKNVGGTSSEVLASTTIGTDTAAGTSIAITTVDAGDYISIKPTGVASETWRWVASVDAVEVAYGT